MVGFNTDAGIWQRMIDADSDQLTVAAAEAFLKFDFAVSDRRRMDELSERGQNAKLSQEEQVELQNYVRAGHVLLLIQSKACRAIQLFKTVS